MSEAISGLIQQTLQQSLENQTLNQNIQQKTNKKSFESYLQNDDKTKTQTTDPTSGSKMLDKLEQLQTDLAQKIQADSNKIKSNQLPNELLEGKSRLSLLKEAYSQMNETKMTSGFENRFMQVENEYKQVEALMKSDKDLSQGELLALQARLYQVSQHIEVMSKVVDQMSGGIKTVLNTNV